MTAIAGTLALLLAHPRPYAVVESMRASGRISDDLARLLEDRLKQAGRGACDNPPSGRVMPQNP